jgi:flavocytochrome c
MEAAIRRAQFLTQHLVESASISAQNTGGKSQQHVIVVGGGLAGLSACHTVIERGGRVVLIDKNPFLGGNSTKATSGINGALTSAQIKLGIPDSAVSFERDTALSATKGKSDQIHPLGKVLVWESAPAVEWLMNNFGLDLSKVSRLGGHSQPRTHRGGERFPGMTITMALMERLEKIAAEQPQLAQILLKSRVTSLLQDNSGAVIGVSYIDKDGQKREVYGPVIIATGGYAADFNDDGLLKKYRPAWLNLPTTNGEHCTGDGIKMLQAIGGGTVDLEAVQVHPTGLVHPDEPDAKVKFLAAEALRGVGGLILDKEGKRFANDLGTRDYVTGRMWDHNKPPYRLILNSVASKTIEWHCKHYEGRGLMKFFKNGEALAKEMGISASALQATFTEYNKTAEAAKQGKIIDPWGKKFFDAVPYDIKDSFYVAIITPVLHYTMGGIKINTDASCTKDDGVLIPGVFGAGEVNGGIHGLNRLGGSSLLDCVVFGRVAGASAAKYLLQETLKAGPAQGGSQAPIQSHVRFDPQAKKISIDFIWETDTPSTPVQTLPPNSTPTPIPGKSSSAGTEHPVQDRDKEWTMAEVSKHNKPDDCWVVVNGRVLDTTKFLKDHPGGPKAILLYAGKDATEEFNMLHENSVIDRYAPYTVIGKIAK